MNSLFPPEIIENTVECYHASIGMRSRTVYMLVLIMVIEITHQ